MSNEEEARQGAAGNLEAFGRVTSAGGADAEMAPTDQTCCRLPAAGVVAIALGAAALGALGVWLYMRSGGNPHHRASHRIDALRHRLNELSEELARYEPGESDAPRGSETANPGRQ